MKGISPIVAVVLLIAIAVIASVGVWYWMGTLTSKKAMPSAPGMMSIAVLGNGKLLVTNLGTTNINLTTLRTSDPHVWVTMCGNASDPVLTPGEQTICDLLTNSGLNESKTVLVYGNDTNTVQLQVNDNTADKSLVGWWSFDDVHGSVVPDDSGNGNDGTIYNGSKICNVNTSGCIQQVPGMRGKALKFDGINDWIDTNTTGKINTTEFSAITLINHGAYTSSGDAVIGCSYWSSTPTSSFKAGYVMRFWYSNNTLTYLVGDKTGNEYITEGIPNNKWVQVGISYGNGALYAYLNGTIVSKKSARYTPNNVDLRIGDDYTNGAQVYFNGTIDEVMIFNRALNANEIDWLYKWGLPRQGQIV